MLHTPSLRLQALAERGHAVAAIAPTAKSTASAVATTTVATSSTTGVSAAASTVAAAATTEMLANVHIGESDERRGFYAIAAST